MRDIICLLVGASGSGKTTIAQKLYDKYGLTQIQSYTTREPRTKDEFGHTFVSDDEFDTLTDMVGFTNYNGHRYCATAQQVEENDIYVIDFDGVEYFKTHYHGSKTPVVCFIDASEDTRVKRMLFRGDDREAIMSRIENDRVKFASLKYVDWTFPALSDDSSDLIADMIYDFVFDGREIHE